MNDLLERHYPSHKQMYEAQSDLQLALRAGYKLKPGLRHDKDITRWLDENVPGRDRNVVNICDLRLQHEDVADEN